MNFLAALYILQLRYVTHPASATFWEILVHQMFTPAFKIFQNENVNLNVLKQT